MTRTTELLAIIKNCNINKYKNCSNCEMCKSELKGRLDALKEEETYLIQFEKDFQGITPIIIGEEIKYKLASIQEEIKLIEEKI